MGSVGSSSSTTNPTPSSFTSNTPHEDDVSSNISRENHEVFLNFRGDDTRYNFTSHLNAALNRFGIRSYMDYNIERGDKISPTLIREIEKAKISIVIFSRTYASSRWCLDELNKIIECSRNGQIVMPVFYHVDPSHVRNQTGTYEKEFAKHKKNFKKDVIKRWKKSLATAASLSGWECPDNMVECELVEEIAQNALQKLGSYASVPVLNIRITTLRSMARLEYEKYLRTRDLNDLQDIIDTLQQLVLLKRDKVLKTNETSDWDDLSRTYELFLELKEEKCNQTSAKHDWSDLNAEKRHFALLMKEKDNRMEGNLYGI